MVVSATHAGDPHGVLCPGLQLMLLWLLQAFGWNEPVDGSSVSAPLYLSNENNDFKNLCSYSKCVYYLVKSQSLKPP